MATRSTIGYIDENSNGNKIYCHWDGYPEYNGKILLEFFTDLQSVKNLISLGAISSLGESIECPEGHNFDNPVKGYTVSYHRDRGEELDILGLNDKVSDAEYQYLFKDGEWFVTGYHPISGVNVVNYNLQEMIDEME